MKAINPSPIDPQPLLLKYRSKIKLRAHDGTRIVPKDQIDYVNASGNYSEVHLRRGECILCSKTLKYVQSKLESPDFIRVHASYLVNINMIQFINSDHSQITLVSGDQLPVSRGQKDHLKKVLRLYFD